MYILTRVSTRWYKVDVELLNYGSYIKESDKRSTSIFIKAIFIFMTKFEYDNKRVSN